MSAIIEVPGPGANVAVLRKERGWGQDRLAAAAGISKSLLGKIERGERALTQGVAASLARALGLSLEAVLGTAPVQREAEARLRALNGAVRRFDLPREPEMTEAELRAALDRMVGLRGSADLRGVLDGLPGLVSAATNHAHAVGTPEAWAMVAEAYSTVYWLAARHRWMILADLAVTKQKLAAQQADPLTLAIAARDEAGVHLNHGDFEDGLAVVERGLVQVEQTAVSGPDRAYALGILHLRGLTLAGRLRDRATADQHIARAWQLSSEFDRDVNRLGIHFGPQNTAVHAVATFADLGRHQRAIDTVADLERLRRQRGLVLPETRTSPLHMNAARSRLALDDRDGALEELETAWSIAPQMARVHPTAQELLRVLTSLHKRSNPRLTRLARQANVPF
ncbi:helix-turn-helix transcriptional regulator [Streptomyces sp. MUM 203J]|uniref:helix-turn-helix domain-containing protein n=1 Tax=Streptomyces sp. MUM 203J TaxID=2791990 RepID=UPI001F0417DD|nr:helix-turn-helix transcriptional regulator [Streptomyces sp. MUM 203J]MCH0541910.1 helix-turn-helix transcriptional regulator [Streptomyces sp. MUM 203J]